MMFITAKLNKDNAISKQWKYDRPLVQVNTKEKKSKFPITGPL